MTARDKCHICRNDEVIRLKEFASLAQVTSDCRPWKKGGKLGICRSCGIVQKITDEDFSRDCEEIYRTYKVYYQAGGREQRVFEQSKGLSQSRSESILAHMLQNNRLPRGGTLLDIGCGNGNLLRSFSKLYPSWMLSGLEFDESNRSSIESIENVCAFYSHGLKDIAEKFDMISMIHCLEHIIDPVHFLRDVRDMLDPQGLLLIEIPLYILNPYDLAIADHCLHFDRGNIVKLLEWCGFEIEFASTGIVPKEMTILARKQNILKKTVSLSVSETEIEGSHRGLISAIAWLKENITRAVRIASQHDLGIFGTSIAGVWLYSEIPDQVAFFVDEDPDRTNKIFLSRPVYHPRDIPDKGSVFIPLPYEVASGISARMKMYGDRFFIPPPFEDNKGAIC